MRDIMTRARYYGLTIGVEFELFFRNSEGRARQMAVDAFQAVYPTATVQGFGNLRTIYTNAYQSWEIGTDGSIRPSDPNCHCCEPAEGRYSCACPCHQNGEIMEIRTPSDTPLKVEELPWILAFAQAMQCRGAMANSTCGLHVHVGAPEWSGTDLANLARLCNKYRPHIDKALNVNPHRKEGYARDIPPSTILELDGLGSRPRAKTFSEITEIWRAVSRYTGLNLERVGDRGAAEFRWANGTIDYREVEAAVLLGVGLVVKAKEAQHTSSKVKGLKDSAEDLKHWRVTLNQMGLIGSTYKSAREILTQNFAR